MALFVPRDRKSLFRQFLSGMYDAVVITDPNGHILEINPRATEHFGYEQEDVLDQPISVFIPGLQTEIVQRIRRGLDEDRHVVIDANGKTKTDQKIACEVAVSSIDLMNPGDLIFTIRNIERRRKLMSTLLAKANAFGISQAALFVCDAGGNVIDCNDAFCGLFGLDGVEEARKHAFADFMGDAPLPGNFKKALAGETSTACIEAEGDGDERQNLEIVLAPNLRGRKTDGVVGSIVRV